MYTKTLMCLFYIHNILSADVLLIGIFFCTNRNLMPKKSLDFSTTMGVTCTFKMGNAVPVQRV